MHALSLSLSPSLMTLPDDVIKKRNIKLSKLNYPRFLVEIMSGTDLHCLCACLRYLNPTKVTNYRHISVFYY